MSKTFSFDDVPCIKITGGLIKGYFFDDAYIFKGIPYARATRFQPPKPVLPWDGVKHTTSYGFTAPQTGDPFISDELKVPHRHWISSEDCQNLNIWTKSLNPQAKMPVLVWLHGGGYISGSSIAQLSYDGKNLCQFGDVVVVSINHRLNILGYLDLSEYGEEYENSGNLGHMDIIAALIWIRSNISSFGGDPGNVTLFGQSGGGMKILDLMQMPEADGLFHRAFVMSGVNEDTIAPPCPGSSKPLVDKMMSELGIADNGVKKLETVPFSVLAETYRKNSVLFYAKNAFYGWGPVKNSHFLGNPLLYGFRETAFRIPLMLGTTICEFDAETTFHDRLLSDPQKIEQRISKKYGPHAARIMEAFTEAYPDKHPTAVLGIDRSIRQAAVKLAKSHAAGKQENTFIYNFTLDFPIECQKPAWHCMDIPFVFHNTTDTEICNIPGVSDALEQQVFSSFIAFSRTGDPNNPSIPYWPSVSKARVPTMVFDKTCCVKIDYDDRLYREIDRALPPLTFLELMKQSMPS